MREKVILFAMYAKKEHSLIKINLVVKIALLGHIHLQDQKNVLNVGLEHIHLKAGLPAQFVEKVKNQIKIIQDAKLVQLEHIHLRNQENVINVQKDIFQMMAIHLALLAQKDIMAIARV